MADIKTKNSKLRADLKRLAEGYRNQDKEELQKKEEIRIYNEIEQEKLQKQLQEVVKIRKAKHVTVILNEKKERDKYAEEQQKFLRDLRANQIHNKWLAKARKEKVDSELRNAEEEKRVSRIRESRDNQKFAAEFDEIRDIRKYRCEKLIFESEKREQEKKKEDKKYLERFIAERKEKHIHSKLEGLLKQEKIERERKRNQAVQIEMVQHLAQWDAAAQKLYEEHLERERIRETDFSKQARAAREKRENERKAKDTEIDNIVKASEALHRYKKEEEAEEKKRYKLGEKHTSVSTTNCSEKEKVKAEQRQLTNIVERDGESTSAQYALPPPPSESLHTTAASTDTKCKDAAKPREDIERSASVPDLVRATDEEKTFRKTHLNSAQSSQSLLTENPHTYAGQKNFTARPTDHQRYERQKFSQVRRASSEPSSLDGEWVNWRRPRRNYVTRFQQPPIENSNK